ncbi:MULTISPECIES: DUF3159 domain-containing protein [Micromonospora]|uniref:Intracellular septation protein A n=1 Tax=Micromonospora yangpuensis TaxID=683228 RepID=A0A1C6UX19_9ACTN|nr:DUF3159 domain-containing protein [Micromonospora yangpuensis]GGL94121.1 hypothetical protein GCM10012279_09610 [Micromonospora yangpuensis]SCL58597.1 Protein of unknown function [Micromonospora yangpuensis]
MTGTPQRDRPESLADLLGGRRGALDATLPAVAFALGWVLSGRSLGGAVAAAVLTGTAVAGWRLRRGDRPRSVLIGLLAVCVAALIAVRTGRATDFFLVQLLSNAASALVWVVSIVVRWPLLGVIVGVLLGQRGSWRRDPALLRAYGRGSAVWAATYLLRLLVLVPLWLSGQVLALVVARVALTWPVVAAALAVSWLVIRRSLPAGHPGLRHPVTPDGTGLDADDGRGSAASGGHSTASGGHRERPPRGERPLR